MNQSDKAHKFAELHKKGDPVVLYNIWDAGSAKALADAGAPALATGSWSVAAAQGYGDGEKIPLDLLLGIISRLTAAVDVPVTVDFEGGYATDTETLQLNIKRLMEAGAIGLNFEDQIIGSDALYDIKSQSIRIQTIRKSADEKALPLVINARTDLFLKESDPNKHASLLDQTLERATAYTEAGASSFFVPGLMDPNLISKLCETVSLPINIMMMKGAPSLETLASLGVARISYGGTPFAVSMKSLVKDFKKLD